MAEIIRIPGEGEVVGGQFVLGRQIGRGGYGVVFEAHQTGVERRVAVKMLLPRALEEQRGVVDRFKREARLASSLTHPSSVIIYAFGVHHTGDEETLGLPYIAMEFLEGESLQDHLLRRGPLSVEETQAAVMEVLGSLAEAHRKGIIHRDIKPDNVFLHQPEGNPRVIKVLDFGISMAFTQDWGQENRTRLTETGLVTGTAEYMAPEQVMGTSDFTPAIDVYAVGCMAYQLLTGRFPYHGSTPVEIAIKHLYDPLPELPAEMAETFFGRVIMRAMSKDPRVRFKDASAFLAVLQSGLLEPAAAPGAEGLPTSRPLPTPSYGGWPAAPGSGALATPSTPLPAPMASSSIPAPTASPDASGSGRKVAAMAGAAFGVLAILVAALIWKMMDNASEDQAVSPQAAAIEVEERAEAPVKIEPSEPAAAQGEAATPGEASAPGNDQEDAPGLAGSTTDAMRSSKDKAGRERSGGRALKEDARASDAAPQEDIAAKGGQEPPKEAGEDKALPVEVVQAPKDIDPPVAEVPKEEPKKTPAVADKKDKKEDKPTEARPKEDKPKVFDGF